MTTKKKNPAQAVAERQFEEALARVGLNLPDADKIRVMSDSAQDPKVQTFNRVVAAREKRKVN